MFFMRMIKNMPNTSTNNMCSVTVLDNKTSNNFTENPDISQSLHKNFNILLILKNIIFLA